MSFNICRGTLSGEIAPEAAEAAWRRLIKYAMLGRLLAKGSMP